MREEADRTLPLETGGVLLGYWGETDEDVVVNVATGPGPKATHGTTEFSPDYAYQDQKIEEVYLNSNRRYTYLGDWHTHPSGEGELSFKDRRTLHRIAKHEEARAKAPLMAVLASNGHVWRLAVFRYREPNTAIARFMFRCNELCDLRTI